MVTFPQYVAGGSDYGLVVDSSTTIAHVIRSLKKRGLVGTTTTLVHRQPWTDG